MPSPVPVTALAPTITQVLGVEHGAADALPIGELTAAMRAAARE